MDRFTVGFSDHTQVFSKFRDENPVPNDPFGLNLSVGWMGECHSIHSFLR